MSLIQERVLRGAALLDVKKPGWWRDINLENFWMGSCSACIVGQLYEGFDEEAFEALGLSWRMADRGDINHGFETPSEENYCYNDLKREWTAIILERRKADEQST